MREVFERVLAGESLWAITGDFTKRGLQPPQLQRNARKDWSPVAAGGGPGARHAGHRAR